jgi:SAM-dependent methyltransferase
MAWLQKFQSRQIPGAMNAHNVHELQRIYSARFGHSIAYRQKIWTILVQSFFQRYVRVTDSVLDLGCGYGEFINSIKCAKKFALDLNPDAPKYLDPSVQFLAQDCSTRWQLEDSSLHVVFSSNFFEHLPDKQALGRTFNEIFRCLAPRGRLIAMGPNIRYLPGKYWDFWDHHLALTEKSLAEGLNGRGFQITECTAKFLPYTMVKQRQYPPLVLELYLRFPPAWRIFGKQFLIIASKPHGDSDDVALQTSGSGISAK